MGPLAVSWLLQVPPSLANNKVSAAAGLAAEPRIPPECPYPFQDP